MFTPISSSVAQKTPKTVEKKGGKNVRQKPLSVINPFTMLQQYLFHNHFKYVSPEGT